MKKTKLTNNMWAGKRCFIAGGGPSLKNFDWSLLDGERWIGINGAALERVPTIAYTHDKRVIDKIFMKDHKDYWKNLPCRVHKFSKHLPDGHPYGEVLSYPETRSWTTKLEEGLYNANNSGATAIHLADILGAKTIYLLGFDGKKSEGKNQFHDYYPPQWNQGERVYLHFRNQFKKIHKMVRAKVYNCNPDSFFDCFEKISLEEVFKDKIL